MNAIFGTAIILSLTIGPVAQGDAMRGTASGPISSARVADDRDRHYPGPGGPDGGWNQGGYRAELRCESRNDRRERCRARTQNRVALVRVHKGKCRTNRDWGYDSQSIWVRNGCRATFAYGVGSHRPDQGGRDDDKGPSTALVVGGVVVAAGLVALLASKKKKDKSAPAEESAPPPPATGGGPAAIEADLSTVPANARSSMQVCLAEAARQVGATGGTRLRFDRMTKLEPGNGGWRINARVTATYADGDSQLPFYCRATPTTVVQLDFIE